MKLSSKEKKQFREELLRQQGGVCPLCEREIPAGQDTLDHNHSTGHIRMVLCRNCNSIEGRVNHWVTRTGADVEQWLTNLMLYWKKDFSHNPVYPSHQTEIDKEIVKLKRQKRKVKRARTKAKYQAKIDRLTKLRNK